MEPEEDNGSDNNSGRKGNRETRKRELTNTNNADTPIIDADPNDKYRTNPDKPSSTEDWKPLSSIFS
jgi:hypothetical protein